MRKVLQFLIITAMSAQAQVEVPDKMEFGGIRLKLTPAARMEVQQVVDELTISEKYYLKKLQQADLHFPVIEEIFRSEGIPEDFKYLCIQESNFIADAVSSSNAVGYWQFKRATAQEVGLIVDKHIDERKNLASSTVGAARYLKKNNREFDNWIYTLMSYNTGLTGAMQLAEEKYFGASSMVIDKNTHWYVLKFLGYKLAYEAGLGRVNSGFPLRLEVYEEGAGYTLVEIAEQLNILLDSLERYNKWLSSSFREIPSDRTYPVIAPVYREMVTSVKPAATAPKPGAHEKLPQPREMKKASSPLMVKVNRLPAVIATPSDSWETLASRAGITLSRLLRYNDVSYLTPVIPGQIYYAKSKRRRALVYYHTVKSGEDLWSVSQRYGLRLNSLMTKNRMRHKREIQEGEVLWMRYIRPASIEIEYQAAAGEPRELLGDIYLEDNPQIETEYPDSPTEEVPEAVDDFVPLSPVEEKTEMEVNKEPIQIKKLDSVWSAYTVVAGDTYFGIARKLNVSVDSLLDWNELSAAQPLGIGVELRVILADEVTENMVMPAAETGSNEETNSTADTSSPAVQVIEHRVKEQETLYGISKKYNVDLGKILQLNKKQDYAIEVGEVILIPVGN